MTPHKWLMACHSGRLNRKPVYLRSIQGGLHPKVWTETIRGFEAVQKKRKTWIIFSHTSIIRGDDRIVSQKCQIPTPTG